MEFIKDPMAIEVRSFEIIKPYIEKLNLSEEETKIYSRIIHASGDVDYAPIIRIHKDVVASMKKALLSGCKIYTDVEMVRTGINKRKLASWGGSVECKIADPEIAKYAKEHGITRSIAAMRHFGKELDGAIVAIGNAPTALFEVIRLMNEENIRPAAGSICKIAGYIFLNSTLLIPMCFVHSCPPIRKPMASSITSSIAPGRQSAWTKTTSTG